MSPLKSFDRLRLLRSMHRDHMHHTGMCAPTSPRPGLGSNGRASDETHDERSDRQGHRYSDIEQAYEPPLIQAISDEQDWNSSSEHAPSHSLFIAGITGGFNRSFLFILMQMLQRATPGHCSPGRDQNASHVGVRFRGRRQEFLGGSQGICCTHT
jgi:hypothetical protein